MSELLPICIISLVLTFFSHQYSVYDLREARYIKKEHLIYTIMVVIIVIYAGLRVDYNDTSTYIGGYDYLSIEGNWLKDFSWEIGDYPLYNLVVRFLKKIGFSSQSYILIFSAFIMGTYLWFIHKYSNHIILSVFLFFTMGWFTFAMAALKQCSAVAFCLIGIDRLLQHKNIEFIVWTVVGTLFHPFAAMFFLCPFLTFRPWTFSYIVMMVVCAVAGFSLQTWLGSVVDMLAIVGIDYDIDTLSNESVNIFRVAVLWAPVVVSMIGFRFWRISDNKANNLMMNLSTICAELMFVALFGNPIYFGRLSFYFLIFQTISLPFMLDFFAEGTKHFITAGIVLGYTGYFVYGNVFNGNTFDSSFARITIAKYITNIFS